MSTPGFPDFTRPVAQIESTAGLQPAHIIPSGGSVGPVDVSSRSSVAIGVVPVSGVAGVTGMLDLLWSDALGTWQLEETITLHTLSSYTGIGLTGLTLLRPVKGPTLTITASTSNGSGISVTIGATSRQDQPQIAYATNAFPARLLLDTGNVNVAAAGSSTPAPIPPVSKVLSVAYSGLVTSTQIRLDGVYVTPAGAMSTAVLARISPGVASGVLQLEMPDTATQLVFVNNSGGANTFQAQAWAAT